MTGARLSMRRPVLLGMVALVVLVLGFGLWSVTAELSGAVVVRGRVEADQARLVVQHPDGGRVEAVRVQEGARVRAGDVLLVLDGAALRSELEVVDLRLADLAARAARLRAERDGLPAPDFPPWLSARASADPQIRDLMEGQAGLFARRAAGLADLQAQLRQRIRQSRAQIEGLVAQRLALAEQLRLLRQELSAQEGLLARGLVPQTGVLAMRRDEARITGQMAELEAAVAVAEGQITEIGLQDTGLVTRRAEEAATELREIEPVRIELETRRAALAERIARLDLRAPVAGTVMGLSVAAPGAVLRAADPALTLVPSGQPLVITAAVPPIHIDEVAPGQRADLSFPALAADAAVRLAGRVVRVSPDAAVDPATGQAQFLVRIEIEAAELSRLGDSRLVPGMPVDVFLATRSRTPLAYLMEPFSGYFRRALREG